MQSECEAVTRVGNVVTVVTVVTARAAAFGGPGQRAQDHGSAPKLTASGGRAAFAAAAESASSSNERGRGPLLTAPAAAPPSGPALAGHGLPGDDSAPARKLGGAETDAPRALHFKSRMRPANPESSSTRPVPPGDQRI